MTYTENTEPAELFRFWTAISCVASVLQRKCYAPWGTLTFYPNLYILLVGPSGSRKGTAMGPGYQLLTDIGIKLSAEATTLQALIRRLKNTNYTDVDPVTGEMQFHASMTIWSEEFTVFLGYQNKEMISALCNWYDCRPTWTYETNNVGIDEIIGVWVNIIGATTPKLIHSSLPLDAIGGGLTSRIILMYEPRKGKTVVLPLQTQEELRLYDGLKADLERIHLLRGRFRYTKKFLDIWSDWYTQAEHNPPFSDERFDGYIDRRPTHVMKLSMIMSASHSDDMIVSEVDLERAINAVEVTEVKMPGAFSGLGRSDIAELISSVCAWLVDQGEATITDLMRRFGHDADVPTMQRVLQSLEKQDKIEFIRKDNEPVRLRYRGKKAISD